MAYFIEKIAYRKSVGQVTVAMLHIINCIAMFASVVYNVYTTDCFFITYGIVLLTLNVNLMKLASFAHTNYILRREAVRIKALQDEGHGNVTDISNIIYSQDHRHIIKMEISSILHGSTHPHLPNIVSND